MEKILKFKKEIICIIALIFMMILSSCGLEKLTSIEVKQNNPVVYIGNFKYEDYNLVLKYDNGRTEEIVLSEDMISDVEKMKLYAEGNQEIKVTYKEKETIFNVNVKRNSFEGVVFDDVETVYTGQDIIMTVKNVPEGTTVSYPGSNKFRNAGTYDVKAILRKDTFEAKEITAKLVIKKADYDLSQIKFEDKTIEYDGTKHNIKVEGTLPAGLAVDYTITKEGGKEEGGNSATNAGTYTVKAIFSGDFNNYNVIEPKTATLTIKQAVVDMSHVNFEDDFVTYDRQSHNLSIEGALPTGVSVRYVNNGQIDVGEYKILAKFAHRDTVNYAPIPDMEATLKIDKANYDLSNIHFDSISADYDGIEKKIVLNGELPPHLKYDFENNSHTDAGTYTVTIKFTNDDPNFNTPDDITAQIVINPISANLDEVVFEKTRFVGFYVFSFDDDVYVDANAFRPTNLPVGLEVDKVVYYHLLNQTEMLVGSLDDYDGVNPVEGTELVERIVEDGYYIAVASFKDTVNYNDVDTLRVKTQIKATSLYRNIVLSGYYDDSWGWTSNLRKRTLSDSLMYLEYDDCSSLTEMLAYQEALAKLSDEEKALVGPLDLFKHANEVISDPLLFKFDKVGQAYTAIDETGDIYYNIKENLVTGNNEFFSNIYDAALDLLLNSTDAVTQNINQNKLQSAIIGIDNKYDIIYASENYVYVKQPVAASLNKYKELVDGVYVATEDTEINPDKIYYQKASYSDYLLMIARLFGYEIFEDNVDVSIQKFKENLHQIATSYLAERDLNNRLKCNGAVYTEGTTNGNCYILPYVYEINLAKGANDPENKEYNQAIATFLIIRDNGELAFWVSDLKTALDAVNFTDKTNTENNILTVHPRCSLFVSQEKGAYCVNPHDAAMIVDENGKEQVLKRGDDILGVDIDKAAYASTANSKMSFKLLTELPDGVEIDNQNVWSYEDFIKGIEYDGNNLAPFVGNFSASIDLYHGATGVRDLVIDEYGNYVSYVVEYPDHDMAVDENGNTTIIEKENPEAIKPIIAVQGIKNIANSAGEFLVYIDIVDTEGFKMAGAWYSTLVIWNI